MVGCALLHIAAPLLRHCCAIAAQDPDDITGLHQRHACHLIVLFSAEAKRCPGTKQLVLPGRFIEEISAFSGDPATILTNYLLSAEASHKLGISNKRSLFGIGCSRF